MDRYFALRGIIPVPLYLPLLLITWHEVRLPWLTWPAGALLIVAGFLLRLSSIRHLGKGVRSLKVTARRVVTSGPYAWTRNPVYLATLMVAAGLAVLSKLLWYAPVLVALLALHYTLVARAEERRLGELYGAEYRKYADRVPRWIPRRPKVPCPGAPEPWGGVWRREWKLAVALAAAAGLLVVKHLVWYADRS